MYYGWRAKVGLIHPATGIAPSYDFHRYLPEGVAICEQRILFEEVSPEGLKAMGDRVEEAAKMLSWTDPDILVFCCTTGSLIGGKGYDQELIRRMEDASGTKAITTSTAVLQALHALNSQKLVVSTPYSDIVNDYEKKFLEDNGFEVLKIKGLNLTNPRDMPRTTINTMYHLNKEVMHPDADTLFVSCTGLGIVDGVPMFERDSKLKLVNSMQATIWATYRAIGIQDEFDLGQLFKL